MLEAPKVRTFAEWAEGYRMSRRVVAGATRKNTGDPCQAAPADVRRPGPVRDHAQRRSGVGRCNCPRSRNDAVVDTGPPDDRKAERRVVPGFTLDVPKNTMARDSKAAGIATTTPLPSPPFGEREKLPCEP